VETIVILGLTSRYPGTWPMNHGSRQKRCGPLEDVRLLEQACRVLRGQRLVSASELGSGVECECHQKVASHHFLFARRCQCT